MGAIKERDYMFDTFRGILILCIPLSHFTKMSGGIYAKMYLGMSFDNTSLAGFIYITINVFVMQAFMFLSGYFSKKPERARQSAFRGVLWPYLVAMVMYFFIGKCLFGFKGGLDFSYPSFALWFLLALFMYRFFLVDMIKFRWLLPMALLMYMIVGQIHNFGEFLQVQRLFSYLPFFLLGYYCSKDRLAQLRSLKNRPALLALLGAALVASSIVLCYVGPGNVGWYLMNTSAAGFKHMPWYADVIMRFVLLIVGSGWIIFMMNILPNKQNFVSYIGTNTMPIYIFHLCLRYVFKYYGIYMGAISCLSVALIGVISFLYVKTGKKGLFAAVGIAAGIGIIIMFASGCLSPIYGMCPENQILFYVMVIGSALTAGLAFVCPFWVKAYDMITEGPVRASKLVEWLSWTKESQEAETK